MKRFTPKGHTWREGESIIRHPQIPPPPVPRVFTADTLKVILTLAIFFCGQLGTAVWFASSVNHQVGQATEQIREIRGEMSKLVERFNLLSDRVLVLDATKANLIDVPPPSVRKQLEDFESRLRRLERRK